MRNRLRNRIEEIMEDPRHYKPLRNVLKNKRRTHIGSYVLIFEVHEEDRVTSFYRSRHHDEVCEVG